jgi:hypothetical protein
MCERAKNSKLKSPERELLEVPTQIVLSIPCPIPGRNWLAPDSAPILPVGVFIPE